WSNTHRLRGPWAHFAGLAGILPARGPAGASWGFLAALPPVAAHLQSMDRDGMRRATMISATGTLRGRACCSPYRPCPLVLNSSTGRRNGQRWRGAPARRAPLRAHLLARSPGKRWLLLCIRNDTAGCAFQWAPIPGRTRARRRRKNLTAGRRGTIFYLTPGA